MERHIAKKEREKQKKIDQKQKQQRDEDTQILFENFFGEKMIWGPMAVTYREKSIGDVFELSQMGISK